MRAAFFLSFAAFLTGAACQAGNIPDIAVDTMHGYAFQTSMVTNTDAEGKPHIFPRQIDSVTYASLEDARKYFQDRADAKVAEIAPFPVVQVPGAGRATAAFVINSPKAMLPKYAFTPNYNPQAEVTAFMDMQNDVSERAFAAAVQRSNLFASVKVIQSDNPAAAAFDGAQYKIWLDDTTDGKTKRPGGAAWIIVNGKNERRMVPLAVGFGNSLAGLPDMVANLQKSVAEIPAD